MTSVWSSFYIFTEYAEGIVLSSKSNLRSFFLLCLWLSCTYTSKGCSESNAQGEITTIRILLEARLFQEFLRPAQRQFRCTVCSSPSTTKRRWRSCFCCWFGWPPPSSSLGALGHREVCRLWLCLSKTEKGLWQPYLANRKAGGSSWCLHLH